MAANGQRRCPAWRDFRIPDRAAIVAQKGRTIIMRAIAWAAVLSLMATFMATTVGAVPAKAAEIRVVAPGFIYNAALKELAADFTKKTGVKVIVSEVGMSVALKHIQTDTPAYDVVGLPSGLMNTLALEGGIIKDTYTPLGRDEIALAVRKGAPHPDISTVEKLAVVLKAGGKIMVNSPTGGTMQGAIIGSILARPIFAGVDVVPVTHGEGAAALARGEGDMALQLVPEIHNKPQLELVAPLPAELGGHMDGMLAVSARAPNPKDARAFIKFITRPAAREAWKAKGMRPF
jgi:molybdate transport system substrate-binding protein